jgi:beta-lactamase class A
MTSAHRRVVAELGFPDTDDLDARLAAADPGFDADVEVAGKTGTIPFVRNEAGVVTYPDGRAFAVAVFTRSDSLADRNPAIDASIGRAARIAVEALRA